MVKSRTLNHVQYDKMFVTGFYYSLSLEISMHYAQCTIPYHVLACYMPQVGIPLSYLIAHIYNLQELSVLINSYGLSVMKTYSMQERVTVPNL
jgi:hypothetical protein